MKDWIPVLQSLIWPAVAVAAFVYLRKSCRSVLDAIVVRITSGASVKAGPLELGAVPRELENLQTVDSATPRKLEKRPAGGPAQTESSKAPELTDWRQDRAEKYERTRGYMLVHVYRRSEMRPQWYEIFLFIVQHKRGTDGPPRRHFAEIEKVEFFFGDAWKNETFTVINDGEVVGIKTEAWGTFLACCRVSFKDTKEGPVVLYRYVDFHMLQDTSKVNFE
jgi:hypothetical protein